MWYIRLACAFWTYVMCESLGVCSNLWDRSSKKVMCCTCSMCGKTYLTAVNTRLTAGSKLKVKNRILTLVKPILSFDKLWYSWSRISARISWVQVKSTVDHWWVGWQVMLCPIMSVGVDVSLLFIELLTANYPLESWHASCIAVDYLVMPPGIWVFYMLNFCL